MTNIEKGCFISLFNRGGYVLDFTTNDFDVFTYESVGIGLCDKYRASKGRSLFMFIHDDSVDEDLKQKLLLDLLEYYENCRYFDGENNSISTEADYDFHKRYLKCCEIRQKCVSNDSFVKENILNVAQEINSEYITKQIALITSNCSTNPTIAIGKSKELVESVCKTILDKLNVQYDRNLEFPKLVRETMKLLNVMPENIKNDLKMSGTLKGICGALASISNLLAELRNSYGDGHGKGSGYIGLEERHARLALGAASTLSYFLWETYKLNYLS